MLGGEREDVGDWVSPLRGDTLHCSSHQRIGLEDSVEVVHREGEQVTIRLSPHTEQNVKFVLFFQHHFFPFKHLTNMVGIIRSARRTFSYLLILNDKEMEGTIFLFS